MRPVLGISDGAEQRQVNGLSFYGQKIVIYFFCFRLQLTLKYKIFNIHFGSILTTKKMLLTPLSTLEVLLEQQHSIQPQWLWRLEQIRLKDSFFNSDLTAPYRLFSIGLKVVECIALFTVTVKPMQKQHLVDPLKFKDRLIWKQNTFDCTRFDKMF